MVIDPPNEVTSPHTISPDAITIFFLNDGPWMFLVHVTPLPFTLLSVARAEGNVHARFSPIPLILNPMNSNGPTSTSKSQSNLLPFCILELSIMDAQKTPMTFAFMLPVGDALSEATFPS